MAYLITCCKDKINPTQQLQGSLNGLYRDDIFHQQRVDLIEQAGITLDWSKTLPAYQLYSGKIYSKISPQNWIKPCVEIKILSALFGWIRHTDLIPYYDLKIDKKQGELTRAPYILWRNSGVLLNVINHNDIDLLSNTYKKAFNGNIPAQIPDNFEFKDRGDCVGYWLENELNNINCNE